MSFRYFIEMQFDGKAYYGWQMQPDRPTVQAEVNEKLSVLLRQPIETVGAGRTDTGVHARHFVAHFDSQKELEPQTERIVGKLNRFLPADIAIQRIVRVPEKAHARYDAIARTYMYYINQEKDVFNQDYSWQVRYNLDIDLMNRGADILCQTNDFTSFSKLHSDVKTNLCSIKSARWSKSKTELIFIITADRFLRNMVRAIVGTLVSIGRKKLTINDLNDIIASRNRSEAGESAPAKGLFLHKIEYPYPL